MGVAVTHRLYPARLGRCYDSFHEVHGIPGSCEVIAASFSGMVMEFLGDPGNGWYRTHCHRAMPPGHVIRQQICDTYPPPDVRQARSLVST